jgi:hypothetical protein
MSRSTTKGQGVGLTLEVAHRKTLGCAAGEIRRIRYEDRAPSCPMKWTIWLGLEDPDIAAREAP